jgi:drug/metabolite transporter (DMT)-like permease
VTTLAPARPADAPLLGMLFGATAYSVFAVHDALIKGIIHQYDVVQILLLRSVVIALVCLVVGRRQMLRDLARSPNRSALLLRAVLTLAAWWMYYPQGRHLQLAEMTTLYYVAPVITLLLAVVFLKERLTLARTGAAAIGFFGVVIAANPSGLQLGLPAILALSAAFCWAVAMILMRTISRSESSLVLVFSINAFYVVVLTPFAIWLWQPLEPLAALSILGTGLAAGGAQYLLIEAARRIPASVLGTVEYSALFWSFVFGFLFWGEQPAFNVYAGAGLVVTAGLLLAWSEQRNRRRVIDTP